MAENKGLMSQLGAAAKNNPAVDKLRDEATGYLQARGKDLAKNLGGRLEGATGKLQDASDNGGLLGKTAKNVAKGDNPAKAAVKGAAGGLKDKVKEKIPGLGGGGGGGAKATKATIIQEEIDVGAPVDVVYDQWTLMQEFSDFMKKVDNVEQEEEVKVDFKAQVFWSHRTWEATIEEQIPDELIHWRSSGEKGHVDGTVTFHELAPRLTRVIVVLEYYPQGFMERTGNIWRAQGRRARLELKHFRRHVMMNVMHEPEEVEGWRGEIHEGEVERSHEEVVEEEQREDEAQEGDADEPEAEYDDEGEEPEADEDEFEEGPEDEFEAEEPEAEEDEFEEEPEDEFEEEAPEEEYEEEPEDEFEEEEPEEEYEEEPPRRRRRAS
ncbi:MAG TPA: SRPBCC family protein [Nocardioidaceae bacterium]|nr:SRPBCC family protein [Nocardioidaceae bacterium]